MNQMSHRFKLTKQGREEFPAFAVFSKYHLASEDIDPVYPVLRYLQRDMDVEQQLWHTFLYVAWYNLASGHDVFLRFPEPCDRKLIRWAKTERRPTGVERRNLRGPNMVNHLLSYLDEMDEWPNQGSFYMAEADPKARSLEARNANWLAVNQQVQQIYGNGRWAGYKLGEILRRVNGFPIEAPDMGNQHSSGPREGLARFYGEVPGESTDTIQLLDDMGLDLQRRLANVGIEVDVEHLETLLCDWKSTAKGKYYVGHDTDLMYEQVMHAHTEGHISTEGLAQILEARVASLPQEYLAEISGHPIDKKTLRERNQYFKNTGRIAVRRKL